ncbi:MAG TPA: class A beta-lactamase [Vicinamibacterales bacterium]|nr:class A beta-lactamase [Vicinamibacterales bacterium]
MTSVMPWKAAIEKELRALFPAWAAIAVAVFVLGLFKNGAGISWAVYVAGAVALGAMSIGHEYIHGTISAWLALPVSRWQLVAAKLAALGSLLASLAILVTVGLAGAFPNVVSPRLVMQTIGLPLVYGLIVAPWLTIIARGPLGGVVFTLAIPLVVALALTLLQSFDAATQPTFWMTMSTVAGAATVLGWLSVRRFEALDTHRDVEFPWLLGASRTHAGSRRRPLWALVAKELRLQQMTLLVAALSFGAVLVARWYYNLAPNTNLDYTYPLTLLHLALVPILAGSLASAEERRLGTLEWQVLQPMATWKQWLVKTTAVVALSILIGLVPLVLLLLQGSDRHIIWLLKSVLPLSQAPFIVAGLAIATLYVSSLSSSGVRAVINSILVLAVLGALLPLFTVAETRIWTGTGGFRGGPLQIAMESVVDRLAPGGLSQRTSSLLLSLRNGLALIASLGLALAVVRFALLNHRSAERGARRVVRQAATLFLGVLVLQFVLMSLGALQAAGDFSRLISVGRKAISESSLRRARWQRELNALTKDFDGRVGVCAGDGALEACTRASQIFPMQSVMKLPVTISALEGVDRGKWRLDDEVLVRKQDLSVFVQPIAKLVGADGFKTTIGDLVRRAIVDSDSAATDILIAKLGGPLAVQLTLNRGGVTGVRVDRDEKHLQTEINDLVWRDEYLDPPVLDRAISSVPESRRDAAFQAYLKDQRDTSTPRGMTVLLESLASGRLLSASSTQFLLETLRQTTTFPDRLKAGVPDGWTIGHKTGTSGSWRGVTAAFNDVGIVTSPKGETISIAVFISDSKASDKDMAKLMADIARAMVAKYH